MSRIRRSPMHATMGPNIEMQEPLARSFASGIIKNNF
jgi:hypothetical protein